MQYVELHCKSNFSFLRGASHPDELVEQAAALGYAGIALTDIASVAGVVRGFAPAKELASASKFKYIVGTEVQLANGLQLVLWPTDRAAYGRMCQLISRGRLRAEKGSYELCWEDVVELGEGMLVGVCNGGLDQKTMVRLRTIRTEFGERAYLLCEVHRGVDDRLQIERLRELSLLSGLPLVAAGDVHYHSADRMLMHDCLTAVRNRTTIDQVHAERFTNSQRHLRTLGEIEELYGDVPDAIARTMEIAERCQFELSELRYEYPLEIAPPGMTLIEHLKRLTWEGAQQRWPGGVPEKIIDLIRHEMAIIQELAYEAYFLTVWDLVRFARQRDILCQGRGSAANSTVCYCLGITSVDPSQTDLLFERFVSRERDEAPDIDVDFEHQRREEVLQYLYDKYGRDHAGMTAVVTSYRTKSAIRDVGKALGIDPPVIDRIAKLGGRVREAATTEEDQSVPPPTPDAFAIRCREGGLEPQSPLGRRFVYLVKTLTGFPRHLSQHVGGMVMTAGPLCELCPIENAAMEGRTVIQWNKDDLDELGILKVDVLSLGMLSAIRRCFGLIEKHHGRVLSLATVPHDDPATYQMIRRADTIGVFQIESRAQMSMLPRLKPKCFYDLVVEVAIVRPGPIQGNMVHPYLQARENPDSVSYPNDAIRGVLEKTLGVPIFQEQAMRLAVVAAGFTPGEADQLRRAMAAWRRPGVIDRFRIKLMEGMKNSGLSDEFAEHVFHQIRGFGEYGFPESHAASFALLAYASSYLKCHYPAAFCAAILNSQPMGFYAPAQLVDDARQHGVEVRPPDVNFSDWDASLEHISGPTVALRLGLRSIHGLPWQVAETVVAERRRGGPFRSIDELVRRVAIGKGLLAMLSDADALCSISGDRRAAVWQSLGQDPKPRGESLFDAVEDHDPIPDQLLPMTLLEEVYADYETTGLSLKSHPISFARTELSERRCVTASELATCRHGRHVRVAGLVILRQRPGTAKGITFVTLEDETGSINLVLYQAVWNRFFTIAQTSQAWLVDGKLENKHGVIHVIVSRITDLADEVPGLKLRSRNFH
jgi:error-prone DNA polymerase